MFPAKKVPSGAQASALIDEKIELLPDWRGKTLAALRKLIHEADPEVLEEWKWGTPVWSHAGILCTGEVYKAAVKMTFPKGAALPDPQGLFNSSLEGNVRRAIDVREGDRLNAPALKTLFRAAVALNLRRGSPAVSVARPAKAASPRTKVPNRSPNGPHSLGAGRAKGGSTRVDPAVAGKSEPTRTAQASDAPKKKAAKAKVSKASKATAASKASKATAASKAAQAPAGAKTSAAASARQKPAAKARPQRGS